MFESILYALKIKVKAGREVAAATNTERRKTILILAPHTTITKKTVKATPRVDPTTRTSRRTMMIRQLATS